MKNLSARLAWPLVLLAILAMASSAAYGQGNTTTLSGVVTDDQGGVVPGADVTAKNNATNATIQGVTDGTGRFTLAGVAPGTYTVTVALMGFKTAVLPDVQVLTGTPASVKVTLKVGTLEETVVVTGQTEIVQATSPTVSSTIAVKQIQQLPVITHTALDYVISLPGIQTAGSDTRGSTINGLSTYAINITLDGINAQDKRGSEGMFMYIRPMMDSVEEITVSTSNSDAAATGARRREHPDGNALRVEPVQRVGLQHVAQPGGHERGRHPHAQEEPELAVGPQHAVLVQQARHPEDGSRRLLHQRRAAADAGLPRRRPDRQGQVVLLLQLRGVPAAGVAQPHAERADDRARRPATSRTTAADGAGTDDHQPVRPGGVEGPDVDGRPVHREAAGRHPDRGGQRLRPGRSRALANNVEAWNYSPSATQKRRFPTVRMDYNLTNAHRLGFSYRYNEFNSTPDFLNSAETRFPGFPNSAGQYSQRYMWQVNLRSTLGKSLVNEVRTGASDAMGDGTYFGKGVTSGAVQLHGAGLPGSPTASGTASAPLDVDGYTLDGRDGLLRLERAASRRSSACRTP